MVPTRRSEKLCTHLSAAIRSQFNYSTSFLVVCLQLKTDLSVAETLLVSPCPPNRGQLDILKLRTGPFLLKVWKGTATFSKLRCVGTVCFHWGPDLKSIARS